MKTVTRRLIAIASVVMATAVAIAACSSGITDPIEIDDAMDPVDPTDTGGTAVGSPDPAKFVAGALSAEVTTEACVLSGGTSTTCYRIVTAGVPADAAIGPFCPPTITSTADEGGIWFDGSGSVYDINGPFIANLATLYGDNNWQFFDSATGLVYITDTQEKFEGAAQPNVAAEFQNQCVSGSMDWVNGGVSTTYLIPTTLVPLSTPDAINSDVGVSLNGIPLAAPAPVSNILGAYTIAAFDDCGGHINPVAGYHYHGSVGCTESGVQSDGHAALLGYAMDGYGIYGMLDAAGAEPAVLDECRGETDDVRGYHYHSASAGENMFIGCFKGDRVATATNEPPGGPPPR